MLCCPKKIDFMFHQSQLPESPQSLMLLPAGHYYIQSTEALPAHKSIDRKTPQTCFSHSIPHWLWFHFPLQHQLAELISPMRQSLTLQLCCFFVVFFELHSLKNRWNHPNGYTFVIKTNLGSKSVESEVVSEVGRPNRLECVTNLRASVITTLIAATFCFPLMATSAVVDADTIQQGMATFRSGDVKGSVRTFNAAIAKDPKLASVMWQRGLSLYYAGQYEDGSKQFRFDIKANPSDAEEIIWTILCESKLQGYQIAVENMPLLPKTDRRPVMRSVYNLFRGEAGESSLLDIGNASGKQNSGGDYFYSRLYMSLYLEAKGDAVRSKMFMQDAVESYYGQRATADYMTAVAKVHLALR